MRTVCLSYLIGALLCVSAQAQEFALSDLGPNGEITRWLVLGYMPIPDGQATWQASLDTDLLASLGGEATIAPTGGQTVTVTSIKSLNQPDMALTWKAAQTQVPRVIGRWNKVAYVQLFNDAQGRYLQNTAAYLYCRLITTAPISARLLLGSDDSAKIWLNGKPVFRFLGQRSCSEDADAAAVQLQSGTNALVVRVDNYMGSGGFCGRFVDASGAPVQGVKVLVPGGAGTPELEQPGLKVTPWERVTAEIPPVPPASQQDLFGARLARTATLLESGGETHRPVRILFYGQSITAQEWTTILVDRLQERYPDTRIEAFNMALGGWTVDRLYRTLKHDILRARPDLICFHAYQGNQEMFERIIQNLRRETCADIILRTAHLAGTNDAALSEPEDDAASRLIRRTAQTYGCEIVEVRREWMHYLKTHSVGVTNLLCDQIHLNRKGNVLMAQLYERHLRVNTLGRSEWTDRVRYYEALRPFEDRKRDEITFTGEGWKPNSQWVESASPKDAMHLVFTGNRVDVIVAPCSGGAKVLMDGKPPSAWGLRHGTLPMPKTGVQWPYRAVMRYFEGPNMLDENWELTYTHATTDWRRFRYRLTGSRTGPDGEGDSEHEFVSKSGRITISPQDFAGIWPPPTPDPAAEPKPLDRDVTLAWKIVQDFADELHGVPAAQNYWSPQYTYVTVADGLPFGKHTLTVMPLGDAPVGFRGVEAFRPPLAASE